MEEFTEYNHWGEKVRKDYKNANVKTWKMLACLREQEAVWRRTKSENLDVFDQHKEFETMITHSVENNIFIGLIQRSLVNLRNRFTGVYN